MGFLEECNLAAGLAPPTVPSPVFGALPPLLWSDIGINSMCFPIKSSKVEVTEKSLFHHSLFDRAQLLLIFRGFHGVHPPHMRKPSNLESTWSDIMSFFPGFALNVF